MSVQVAIEHGCKYTEVLVCGTNDIVELASINGVTQIVVNLSHIYQFGSLQKFFQNSEQFQ